MSSFFTNHFKAALAANQALMDGQKVKLVLFRFAPAMGSDNPAWTAARTVAELTAQTGWVEVTGIGGYPLVLQTDVGTRTYGSSRYVIFTEYPFSGLTETAEVRAIGVVFVGTINGVANPLIMVTNTPIGGVANLAPVDALTASPDTTFPDATNRWLFGWGVAIPDPIEGPLVLSKGSPSFEVSGSQHTWLYPRRANMIANPNFEKPGTGFWSGNSSISRVSVSGVTAEPAYLNPEIGQVSTPHHASFNLVNGTKYRMSVKAKFDQALYSYSFFVNKGSTTRNYLFGTVTGNNHYYLSAVNEWVMMTAPVSYGVDHTIGIEFTPGTAAAVEIFDGVRINRTFTAPPAFTNNSEPLQVGSSDFRGRLDWAKLEQLDAGGNVVATLWHFDPNDYPGTGTTYTDPRGRTWTLTNAAAIISPPPPPSATPATWAGRCAGTGGYAIMESNIFPTQMGELDHEQWTVQLLARGSGRLKVGFVFWDADYRVTACDWGDDETWTLNANSWIHIATHRHAPEGHMAMLRLELEGTGLTIDRVLAERGYLKDWLYFDGDERYGSRDDFSWYGGSNRQGASYSLWYNHRKAVTGRLFARTVDPNDPEANVTDEDMEEQGLVYRWVPAGITVVPHLDIFYPGDVQNPLPAKPAGVLPRYSVSTPDGVSNPW